MSVVVAMGLGWMMSAGQIPDAQPDYYAYLFDHLREPVLWLLAVGVLGGIRQRQFDAAETLMEEAVERRSQAAALAEQCAVLRQEVARLEHAVAVTGAGNAGLSLELLGELSTAPRHRLEETFRNTLAQLIGAEGIELVLFGEASPRPYPENNVSVLHPLSVRQRSLSSSLVDALLSSGRPLSCVREQDAAHLSDVAMAAPILGRDGDILGAVLVGEVDPDCLCEAGEAALSVSCFILGHRIVQGKAGAAEDVPAGLAARGLLLQGIHVLTRGGNRHHDDDRAH